MSDSGIRVGIAKRDITPPVGLPMAGYSARSGNSTGVADSLHARAMTIRNTRQGKRVAFVVSDLVAYDAWTLQQFRNRVEAETGLAPDDVILAVTHTHSGPAFGSFHNAYSLPRGEKESDGNTAWSSELPGMLLAALKEAVESESNAVIALASSEAAISTHRRVIDPLGEVRLAPNPGGVTDPTVSLLQARDPLDGRVLATMINHACHPVVLCEDNLLFSGDYPAYALQQIEKATGAPALFFNGACGNVNPLQRGDFEAARSLGAALARSALQALETAQVQDGFFIGSAARTVALPLKFPAADAFDEYLAAAETAFSRHRNPENFEGRRLHAEVERARDMKSRLGKSRRKIEGLLVSDGNALVRLQALQLGPAALVALPGEVFVELGLEIRSQAAQETVFVVGYANESIGYVPTESAYAEGGYEVDVSHLASGAGETLLFEAVSCLQAATSRPGETA